MGHNTDCKYVRSDCADGDKGHNTDCKYVRSDCADGDKGHNTDCKYVRSDCADGDKGRNERENEEYCPRTYIRNCYLGHRINNIIKYLCSMRGRTDTFMLVVGFSEY
jgi:hypothetical protein